ncbi:lytic transglycosylase [Falsochrobactrum shanghaiense]|uniref:Lytic transglycosylase n=1 Tax=Falsochrobactrum shanghaiense TaxID=2201899 RepID=A0A316J505_9HYPH|nr:transglycosylase SLT domain-containing protein [Falsochrobactrum shanghaiense]PWL17012.1 lytic transglycosylase [Falsochrobactrum shanghaiense]
MKVKFVVVCALVGAMSSFGLSSAFSAPVNEPTNLAELFKRQAEKKAETKNPAKAPSGSTKSTKDKNKSAKSAPKAKGSKNTASKDTRGPKAAASNATAGSKPFSKIINHYAKSYGIPSALAHAVVRHESNYRPNVRGRAGEIGLMQIKLSTARGLGYSGSAKGLYEPSTNIQYGMKYLAMAQKLGGGSTCGTILKYNAGHGAKRMNPTSAKYCNSVKAYMRSF